MTVQQQGEMTALEETHWMAIYRDEPWGHMRTDAALAQIAQLLFNVNAKKQDRRPLTDFMLYFRKKLKPQDDITRNVLAHFGKLTKDK